MKTLVRNMPPVFRPALVLFLLLTLICGVLYPVAATLIGRLAFPEEVAGSMVRRDGKEVGSLLIGQSFSSPRYFWGRPSATAPMPNNAAASGGSNLGPSNPALLEAVQARIAALRALDPGNLQPIPVDLVTASGSGLDPDISLAAAYYQAGRVARERQLAPQQVRELIDRQARRVQLDFLGEPRVSVLKLNLALDGTIPG